MDRSSSSAFIPPVASSCVSNDKLGIRSLKTLSISSSSHVLTTSPTVPSTSTTPRVLTHPVPQRQDTRPYPEGGIGKDGGTIVVLFRGDLRIHDHAALSHAIEESSNVIPIYVFDTRQFGSSRAGFLKTGQYRAKFLIDSVKNLRNKLENLGSGLIIRVGIPEKIIPQIVKQTRCKRVFVHKEINLEEISIENQLVENLSQFNCKLQKFWSNTLYYEEDLPFSIKEMPDVYTEFRERVDSNSQIRKPLPPPESLNELPKYLEKGKLPSLSDLGISPSNFQIDDSSHSHSSYGVATFIGGEDEALKRLKCFVNERKHLKSEYTTRGKNEIGDIAVHTPDFACKISAWLAVGCLSPRLIFDEMAKMASPNKIKSSYTYYELVWRDFFRCITAKYSEKRFARDKSPVPV